VYRRSLALALALVVALVSATFSGCTARRIAVACVSGSHHPAGDSDECVSNATPAIRAKLLATARQMARENHGVAQRVVVVEASDGLVNAFLTVHGYSKGIQVEWVVEASGHFKCGIDCFSNEPTSAHSESVLTLVIDATTLRVTGFEISDDWFNLARIGRQILLQA
jgi:hypothetical protein